MRTVSSLLLSLALISACVAQPPVTAQYENLPGVAIYNNGYLLSWDTPQYTRVALYDRDAKLAYIVPERKSDSSDITWAVDSDGVVGGAYVRGRPSEGYIDLLDSFGNVTLTINTGSHIPQQLVFAPDHTIWTGGYNEANRGTQDFNVLHHYARTGEELGQALPWSQISGDFSHPVIGTMLGGQLLYVANDRIGWNAALHPGSRTWIEVSFSGVFLGKYDLKTTDGLSLFPVAMTASGNAYAMIFKSHSARFAVLDRSKGAWQKLVGDPGGVIIGSEGDNLVFLKTDGARTTLRFAPSGSLRVEEPQR